MFLMNNEIHEECGVFGVYAAAEREVAGIVYTGLYALQHRGQESCGIAVGCNGRITLRKDLGLVGDVFTPKVMKTLGEGRMAVGHVRYGTTGGNDRDNAQPILTKHPACTMAVVHNGNLVNAYALRRELENNSAIFHTTSDTEMISYIITTRCISDGSPEEAVLNAMDILDGAYSLILMFGDRLIAARDKHGFRPLCYGKTPAGDYIIASESCALDAVNAYFIRDIKPGEVVVFDETGVKSLTAHCGKVTPSPCIFEYIYFARPDSVIDGHAVHQARINAGRFLAIEHPAEADVVIGVPDSGIDAAIGYSAQSGIPYGIGFIKNKYIGRTFIAPLQSSREQMVKIKLNPITETVRGKQVVMIDDSIVRGTTSARIVGLLRDAGATEIHVRITAPPFLHPCYYGTDIDSAGKLIANNHSVEEIRGIIEADSLGYLNTDYLPLLISGDVNFPICRACFDGRYPTQVPGGEGKEKFEC